MTNARGLALLLVLAPFLAGAEGGCGSASDSSDDEPANPNPNSPFTDSFGATANWRLTTFTPNLLVSAGNPAPCFETGSASGLATGGLTHRVFDATQGLIIEADVYWIAPTGLTTVPPKVWIGLSDEDDPTGTAGLAAGVLIDDAGAIHYQVNGVDIGQDAAFGAGVWRRVAIRIRTDRVVEFRIDDVLRLTGGSLDAWYLSQSLEACGTGWPERPRLDNITARLP